MSRAIIFVLASLLGLAGIARADHRTFALIVTNNHSFESGRPDLQYADDDGAKYYTTFRALASDGDVRLLTELDRDSARLFPALVGLARPPNRREVESAADELGRAIATAASAGATTDFYFIYAGHGDVDGGRGFIELVDARLYSDDLEALLAKIPATHIHVILDSCNSFFVINARKPGGHRFATPNDAAASLTKHLPNVGVFLSTSAEAEVFEWSELQSGVFSHAVRSGLAGAADANGDGVISYDELRAFVDIATANVRNAAFRPKVYARGPSGDDTAAMLTQTATGPRLRISATHAMRVTVRDHDELPWLDTFAEAGATVTLNLPPLLADATVEELATDDSGAHLVRRSRLSGGDALIALADLPAESEANTARGLGDVFRGLFTKPFGPAALATYDAEREAAPPPVFGVSHEDAERMELLLHEIDDGNHAERIQTGEVMLGGGLVIGSLSLIHTDNTLLRTETAAIGLTAAITGLATLIYQTDRERFREHFMLGTRRGDPAQVVAITDAKLHVLAARSARLRHVAIGCGVAIAALGVALAGVTHADHSLDQTGRLVLYGTSASVGLLGGAAIVTGQFEAPIERAVRLWDGTASRVQLTAGPIAGGGAIGVAGSF